MKDFAKRAAKAKLLFNWLFYLFPDHCIFYRIKQSMKLQDFFSDSGENGNLS